MARRAVVMVAVLLYVLFVTAGASARRPLPPVYSCTGSYRTCATTIGQQAAGVVKLRLGQPDVVHALKVAAGSQGQAILRDYKDRLQKMWPHLMEEMQGMADGSGVSFDDILVLNSLDEFNALEARIGKERTALQTPQCTGVYSNNKATPCLGHNEDNIKWIANTTYFVNVTIYNNNTELVERYFAFAYPGTMGGNYFGWNHHGLVFSDEFIFAKQKNFAGGVPSNIHSRAAYSSRTMDEVILTMMKVHTTSGYNLDVASTVPDPTTQQYRIVLIEGDPMASVGVYNVNSAVMLEPYVPGTPREQTWYRHTNLFQFLNVSFLYDASSVARVRRIDEIVAAKNSTGFPSAPTDLRELLGDTHGTFPIYRNGTKQDNEVMTLATVVYDLVAKTASVWANNPKENDPDAVFSLW